MASWIPMVDAYKALLVRPTQFIDYKPDKGTFFSKKFSKLKQICEYTTEAELAWNSFMCADGKICLISSTSTEATLTLSTDDLLCGINRLSEYAESLYSNKSLRARGVPFTTQIYNVLPNEIPEVTGVWVGNSEPASYNERMFVVGKSSELKQGAFGERITKIWCPATEFELTDGSSILRATDSCFNRYPVATRRIVCEHLNRESGGTASMRPVIELPADILVQIADDKFDGSSPERALQIKIEHQENGVADELDAYLELLKDRGGCIDKASLARAMHKVSEIRQRIYELQMPF